MIQLSQATTSSAHTAGTRPAGAGVGGVHARRPGEDARRTSTSNQPDAIARGEDRVELSAAAVQRAYGQEPGFRAELVKRVRAEIAAGTYETPEKIDQAATRLSGSLDTRA